jgi:hypothetical protein
MPDATLAALFRWARLAPALFAVGVAAWIAGGCDGDGGDGGGGAGAAGSGGHGQSLACPEMCERAQACDERGVWRQSCAEACAQLDELGAVSGCAEAMDDFMACAVGAFTDCNDSGALEMACAAEVGAYSQCLFPYCDANESAPECAGVFCSYGMSGDVSGCSLTASCTGGAEVGVDCPDPGGDCTCSDGAAVPFDPLLCGDDLDLAIDAAEAACGWLL